MKTLILFIASLAAVFGQGFRLNPITGQLDLIGGYTAPSGYSATVTAQTTITVTAASHGQGTAPIAYCFDNASPANAVACSYTVSSIGDAVFTWSPAFTGTIIIRGPGADAGAAGNVVGPASSTSGAVAFYSGTSGKVLTQAASGLFYDAANVRLGVGTGMPGSAVDVVAGVGSGTVARFISSVSNGVKYELVDNDNTTQRGMVGFGAQFGGSANTDFGLRSLNSGNIVFISNALERARITWGGNLLLGTTTDGNYKLDIAASGSSGTLRVFDQTATTGNTKEVIQAGPGQSTNLTEWQNNAGTVKAYVDASGNVRTSGASFFSGGDSSIAASGAFYWDTRTILLSPSNGVMTLLNSAQNDFGRLQFGGTTSSFPALKRSSAILQARLADDSAYTDIQVSSIITKQTTPSASTDACTAGSLWADADYVYACTASGTIKRATLNTF